MWNVTVWTLVVTAFAGVAGAGFLPPYQCGMRRVDVMELRRRRHLVAVLQANCRARALPAPAASGAVPVGAPSR
ncbi:MULTISPECIES: hypothetical protein [Streptomyces]|uniref:Secreted protein n=1 Tax=Streptomyces thermoviolaceus subsp. thermoviolaceus TaxID=66860 RepID=A0ABX0Z2L5_STRTL|nr:hypothetical protein [Streptomyces thermoviolaceus]MCM3265846.1 hypothetical protein [Streptomyces thermoviolaceus]NJP17505.1 hypothetical protein [Streptomyces thermoviolaceus subsp. thermoviolaceus]WTD48557.1 hypothetical protein OG899_14105 [Streptomyces thermoviolaceus]GGV83176.1 hypothetical protein GCM10010499_49880 [Streptomyces thermoviolaceus subsp. apingens]GHB11055.1 hypothetical protein GCM10010512_48090 [Streptomyces thermoviolaceus subsp. thermoviolaceus]